MLLFASYAKVPPASCFTVHNFYSLPIDEKKLFKSFEMTFFLLLEGDIEKLEHLLIYETN